MRRLPVERARESYDLWNAEGPEAVAERFWAEDIVGVEDPSVPDAGEYRGRAEVGRWVERMGEVFGDFRLQPEELFEHDGVYLVVLRLEGAGPRGGVPVSQRIFHVFELDDRRRIRLFRNFLDRDRAWAALASSRMDAWDA